MKKQTFTPQRDGFCGAWYPLHGAKTTDRAVILMLGDSSEDRMAVSAAKWLHRQGCHALAMWLDGAKNTLSLGADDPAVLRYLHGETLPCAAAGWTLVQVDGHSLGWGKSSAGTLKNHYPKGLRRV